MQWYAMMGTQTFGPMDSETIADWIQKGALNAHGFVRDEATAWTPIAQSPFGAYLSPAALASAPQPYQSAQPNAGDALGIVIVIAPFLTTILIWLWVGGMNLFQDPGSTLLVLSALTVFGTALLIAIDASQAGMGRRLGSNGKGESGPIAWFFVTSLLWAIAFPWYLHKRRHFGRRPLVIVGLLTAGLFLFSTFAMGQAIETKKKQIRQQIQNIENLTRQF